MAKMNFDDFTKEVVEKVKEYLPETFKEARVELMHVVKNNNLQLTGLVIKKAANNICPTIYLERFFEDYQAGEDMNQIIQKIADIRINNEVSNVFDVSQIMDFEKVKKIIVPRLIGKEQNKKLLENQPHMTIEDLAVTYHILVGNEKGRVASAPITNELMNEWCVKVEDIHDIAIKNMHTILPSRIEGMSAVLSRLAGKEDKSLNPDDEIMFVLSNTHGFYGASAVLDKRIMSKVVDRFEKAFYVLPSSVHELLIVPDAPDIRVEQLEGMVQKINKSTVSSEDRLSDHVYRYSLSDGLTLAR